MYLYKNGDRMFFFSSIGDNTQAKNVGLIFPVVTAMGHGIERIILLNFGLN